MDTNFINFSIKNKVCLRYLGATLGCTVKGAGCFEGTEEEVGFLALSGKQGGPSFCKEHSMLSFAVVVAAALLAAAGFGKGDDGLPIREVYTATTPITFGLS